MSDLLYAARAKLTRCFWPPERLMPWRIERAVDSRQLWPRYTNRRQKSIFSRRNRPTFSPISVRTPPGSSFRSGASAQASITFWNAFSSCGVPKRMLSFRVAFWIQACWGTNAREPCSERRLRSAWGRSTSYLAKISKSTVQNMLKAYASILKIWNWTKKLKSHCSIWIVVLRNCLWIATCEIKILFNLGKQMSVTVNWN